MMQPGSSTALGLTEAASLMNTGVAYPAAVKGAHLVSSSFILFRKDKDGNDEKYCMGDCAINIDYQDTVDKATGEVTFTAAQKLAEVAFFNLQNYGFVRKSQRRH